MILECENCGASYEEPLEDFWHDATCKRNRYSTARFCCIQCGREFIRKRVLATNRERYGADHFMKTQEGVEKLQESMVEKYGVTSPSHIPEVLDKMVKGRQAKMPQIVQKCRETWLEKYGVDHPSKCQEVKDKIKQTFMDRYGYDNHAKSPEARAHMSEKMASQEVQDKMKQTCMERYGQEYVAQVPEFKEKMTDEKKRNNTLRSSSWEEKAFTELEALFGEGAVLRNHQDDRYVNPETGWHWMCDFYIPRYDLFLELFGHQSHGGMPFDPNNPKCIEKLEEMKVSNWLEIWTKLDPLKRKVAREKGLNFLEGFSVPELMQKVKNFLFWVNLGKCDIAQ